MTALPGARPHEIKDFIRNESNCSGEPEPDLSRAEGPLMTSVQLCSRALTSPGERWAERILFLRQSRRGGNQLYFQNGPSFDCLLQRGEAQSGLD